MASRESTSILGVMDPVDALNRLFPSYTPTLGEDIRSARDSAELSRKYLLLQLMERPSPEVVRRDAIRAPAQLDELISKTNEIQNVGQKTLENVKEVTQEIKRLDRTKENLTASIRMLRQLKMLSKLYSQLDSLLKERQYEDMAGSVKAASDLIEYFRPFRPLPQVAELSQEIGAMEAKIYSQIQEDFAKAVSGSNSSGALPSDVLRAGGTVLDSLDAASGKHTSRDKLMEWYGNTLVSEYTRIFSPNDEAGSLENVSRRYTYLKNKVLGLYLGFHTHYFPETWDVRSQLMQKATERTARDLAEQAARLQSSQSDDMQLLLSVIQETLDFEAYAKMPNSISEKLMPYLSLWVEFQDRQLGLRINNWSRTMTPPEEGSEVIPSSKELVNIYRALLSQFTKFKQSKASIQLATVMATHLGKYATKVLLSYLPTNLRGKEDISLAGVCNATAEYIIDTTHQLEKTISANLPGSENVEDLFEELALSRYRKVTIKIEDLFVSFVQRSLEPSWNELSAQYTAQRDAGTDVSQVSPYTNTLVSIINGLLYEVFRAAPTPSMVYGVGTRVGEVVCVGFLTTVMARIAKPVHESQAEQMLLDFGSLKTLSLARMLENAPADVSEKKGAARLGRLSQRVSETSAQAEAIIKILITPSEPLETFIRNYHLLIKDRSTLNFRKILEVKGARFLPRVMEKFRMMAGQEPHLAQENSLLRQIPTVLPQSSLYDAAATAGASGGFGINNFKKIGDFLRRDHQ